MATDKVPNIEKYEFTEGLDSIHAHLGWALDDRDIQALLTTTASINLSMGGDAEAQVKATLSKWLDDISGSLERLDADPNAKRFVLGLINGARKGTVLDDVAEIAVLVAKYDAPSVA